MPAVAQRRLRQRAMELVRPWLWLGFVVVALVIAIFAESRAQPGGEAGLVTAAETTLTGALRAGDKSAARKLLSLQFTFADENGKVFTRKEFLSDLKGVAASDTPTDVKASVYGLVGMVTGSRNSARGSTVFFLDIWAKQKGTWHALTMQDVAVGTDDAQIAAVTDPSPGGDGKEAAADGKPSECKNPCDTIPYRVRSPAEQDVITTLQEITKAAVAGNADAWAKHVADDFVLYRTDHAPITKSAAVASIEGAKTSNIAASVSAIESMRLSVYGDGAAMIANYASPDKSRPPYRAASVWAKRNGQWQLVIEVETDLKG
jgi:ketosteroid isomerase-like protein